MVVSIAHFYHVKMAASACKCPSITTAIAHSVFWEKIAVRKSLSISIQVIQKQFSRVLSKKISECLSFENCLEIPASCEWFSEPCRNGGTCFNSEAGYYCICRPQFTGEDCSKLSLVRNSHKSRSIICFLSY